MSDSTNRANGDGVWGLPARLARWRASSSWASKRLALDLALATLARRALVMLSVVVMRRNRYPRQPGSSIKKERMAKIKLLKKLASHPSLTRCNARGPVKFFPLYDRNKFDAFSRQSSRSRGWCGCQPTPTKRHHEDHRQKAYRRSVLASRSGYEKPRTKYPPPRSSPRRPSGLRVATQESPSLA